MNSKDKINYYLKLAEQGQFPLFFKEWLIDADFEYNKEVKTTKYLESIIEKTDTHQQFERKRTALLALTKKERSKFIAQFLKLMDQRFLKESSKKH